MQYNKILASMTSEFFVRLIDHQAGTMDLELQEEHPSLSIMCPEIYYYTPQKINEQEKAPQTDFSEEDSSEQETPFEVPKLPKDDGFSMRKVQSYNKRKPIRKQSGTIKHETESSSTEEQSVSTRQRKRGKKGQAVKAGYPTKNFLPNFKSPHINFLVKKLGRKVLQHPYIQALLQKNGINLSEYEGLYKIQEFQEAFEAMFRCRYLYRELQLSRSDHKTKLVFHRHLYVFEEAFISKSFTKIN